MNFELEIEQINKKILYRMELAKNMAGWNDLLVHQNNFLLKNLIKQRDEFIREMNKERAVVG